MSPSLRSSSASDRAARTAPFARVRASHGQRDLAFLELELLARAGHLRVAQRQRAQAEVVCRARIERDARVAAGVHQVAPGRRDAHARQRVRRDDDRYRPADVAGGDDHVAGSRQRQPAGETSVAIAGERGGRAVLFDGDVARPRIERQVSVLP